MQEQTMQFDFTRQMVNATSTRIALAPGDKVVWRKQHRRTGASFDVRCTVVKATTTHVRVLCRWIDKRTGAIETDERNVARRCIYRYDWPEVTR